jgi:hypothetical protein
VTRACPHCGGMVNDEGVRPGVGVDWFCAHCGAAGTLTECDAGGRNVVVREVTVPGDPAMRRDWVAAESMPYAERVRPIGGDRG